MKVISLMLKTDEGEKTFEALNLIADHGVEGDKKAKGGERQVCLADEHKLRLYRAEGAGTCVKRFMPNIATEGLDYITLKAGDMLSIGNAEIEISPLAKRCFDECPFVKAGNICAIKENCAFGMITKSGTVHQDDDIRLVNS